MVRPSVINTTSKLSVIETILLAALRYKTGVYWQNISHSAYNPKYKCRSCRLVLLSSSLFATLIPSAILCVLSVASVVRRFVRRFLGRCRTPVSIGVPYVITTLPQTTSLRRKSTKRVHDASIRVQYAAVLRHQGFTVSTSSAELVKLVHYLDCTLAIKEDKHGIDWNGSPWRENVNGTGGAMDVTITQRSSGQHRKDPASTKYTRSILTTTRILGF